MTTTTMTIMMMIVMMVMKGHWPTDRGRRDARRWAALVRGDNLRPDTLDISTDAANNRHQWRAHTVRIAATHTPGQRSWKTKTNNKCEKRVRNDKERKKKEREKTEKWKVQKSLVLNFSPENNNKSRLMKYSWVTSTHISIQFEWVWVLDWGEWLSAEGWQDCRAATVASITSPIALFTRNTFTGYFSSVGQSRAHPSCFDEKHGQAARVALLMCVYFSQEPRQHLARRLLVEAHSCVCL